MQSLSLLIVVLVDQLEPIFALVSSWHKLEFESWPALLDEIQSQFEKNAGKVSFSFSFLISCLSKPVCQTCLHSGNSISQLKTWDTK